MITSFAFIQVLYYDRLTKNKGLDMKKTIFALGLCVALVGCTKSLDEVYLPTNKEEVKEVSEYINKNLEGEDKELATELLMQSAMAITMNMPIDSSKNLQEMIDEKKVKKEVERAEKAKIDKVIDKMNEVVEVVYIDHKSYKKTGLPYDFHDIEVRLSNKQDKPIYGVKGNLHFTDIFGKDAGKVELEYMGNIRKDTDTDITIKTVQRGMDSFKGGEYSPKNVIFKPEMIVFKDKTSISIAKE